MDSGAKGPFDDALQRFATLMRVAEPKLEEAALALSAVLQPGLDVTTSLSALDALADSCPEPTRQGVVEHLFASRRFGGENVAYGDWRNSCIDHVLHRRRGIPITLAVVTIEVARRVGVPLIGVGMPAHFLVGDPDDPDWFLDGFNDGQVLDIAGCRALYARVTGEESTWHDAYLQAASNRAIIARMLNNLKSGFAHRGDRVRLAMVMRMRMAIVEIEGEDRESAHAQAVLN